MCLCICMIGYFHIYRNIRKETKTLKSPTPASSRRCMPSSVTTVPLKSAIRSTPSHWVSRSYCIIKVNFNTLGIHQPRVTVLEGKLVKDHRKGR
jgi:hypothetical protein